MVGETKRFRSLSDVELIDLLYTAGDRLPREAVDEILSRERRMFPHLREIVVDKTSWTQGLPEWWSVVHATYILGAMEEPEALLPLMTALRWADAFDCDWVSEELPAILARFGTRAWDPLETVAWDASAGPGARSIALVSLAAISLDANHLRARVIESASRITSDPGEDLYLRQTGAHVLIDFRATAHRDLLVAFGREEAKRKQGDPEYSGVFYDWEVDELLSEAGADALEEYRRDWMVFYDPEEMENRQERWQREQEEAEKEQPAGADFPRADLHSPCPCGSGWPFDQCCYLKVH